MDNRDEYGYGWNEKGARFHALKSGGRGGRVNMSAAWCNGELFAPFTVEGACNRSVFETWLKTCLIPTHIPHFNFYDMYWSRRLDSLAILPIETR